VSDQCYMCDKPGPTREHVPPRYFFPRSHWAELVTVPSCDAHNHDNSLDVEYVRNVLVTSFRVNHIGRTHSKKAIRSFQNSPRLAAQTFSGGIRVLVDGVETGMYNADLSRIKRVFSAMASALYFHTFRERYQRAWEVFIPGLLSIPAVTTGTSDGYDALRELLASLPYRELPTPHAAVFQCGTYGDNDTNIVFLFRIYGGVDAYAFTRPHSCELP